MVESVRTANDPTGQRRPGDPEPVKEGPDLRGSRVDGLPPAAPGPQPGPPPRASAEAPSPAAARLVPPPPEGAAAPQIDIRHDEARVLVKTDHGELALHLRVKDGVADVSADGQAAARLFGHGRDLEAQLAREGLSLGRFQVDVHRQAAAFASADDDRRRSRQEADEDDGTPRAEPGSERPISGEPSRSRGSRGGRVHIKA
ncbi:MAG: hypothetical protein KA712_15660 [Myxococcales bacterium]|nr:hypothetical protein [Myxococcales bacterium]